MADRHWDWSPVRYDVMGDSGPWTWEVPLLWRALANPGGGWESPGRPWMGRSTQAGDELDRQITYWCPLLDLTFGALGWVRPEIGVHRWVQAGIPTGSPTLAMIRRWRGEDAAVLAAWSRSSSQMSFLASSIAEHTGTVVPDVAVRPDVACRDAWTHLVKGGSDSLHLGHVLDRLVVKDEGAHSPTRVSRRGTSASAALVMDHYGGWYSQLATVGNELPPRPDGRSWRVDVVAKPIDHLGTYRRSRVTGRWFTGPHSDQVLGWPQ